MSSRQLPQPPGPVENPLIQLRQLRADFLGYLLRAARSYGDLVRLRPAPGAVIYLVNHPDLVRDVLVTRATLFRKTRMTNRMVGKFLGNGLVLAEGAEHHAQRRIVQPAFHGRRLHAHAPLMACITQAHIKRWADGSNIDLDHEMTALSMNIVARTLFGVEAGEDAHGVSAAMAVFAESMSARFRSLPWPDWLPTARHRAERRAIADLDRAIDAINIQRTAKPAADDLMAWLAQEMTPAEIRDQLATLYFAGHETTAKLLTWTCCLLAQHPAVEQALREELARELAGRMPAVEDLARLTYMDQVLNEVLRIYPPAWVFDREPLEDIELGGYSIAKGATIYLSPYVAHRDARYFPEAERFDPERFGAGWEQRISRYVYFPFGTGPRNCIGRGFAEINAKLSLAILLQQVQLQLLPGQQLAPQPAATLRPQAGLQMRVQRLH